MSLEGEKGYTDGYIYNCVNNKEESYDFESVKVQKKNSLKEEFFLNSDILIRREEILNRVRKSQGFENVCLIVV
jgi:hypothetical protein